MQTESSGLRLITGTEVERAVEVQARAFHNDPLWVYMVPDERERATLLRTCFRFVFRMSIGSRQAYGVATPLDGVAWWSAPQQRVPVRAILRAGLPSLILSSFFLRVFKVIPILAHFEEMQKRYAPEPHYYLNTIAVAPEAQGTGLASKLIRPFVARADAERVSMYTETMTPANVTLYEHYGFRTMEEYKVPNTNLRVWGFYRPVPPR